MSEKRLLRYSLYAVLEQKAYYLSSRFVQVRLTYQPCIADFIYTCIFIYIPPCTKIECSGPLEVVIKEFTVNMNTNTN